VVVRDPRRERRGPLDDADHPPVTGALGLARSHAVLRGWGGPLVLAGVVAIVVAALLSVADPRSFAAARGAPTIGLAVALALLGVGLARLGTDGSRTFASVLGRRGARTFGAGLLILAAILALSCTGQLPRTMTYVLIVPFVVAGLTTVTGLVLTILALLVAGGPDRRLAWLFIAAVVGLLASDPLASALVSHEARQPIALAFGALASSAFVAALAGMGVLAIRRDRAADVSGVAPGEGEMGHAAG
jgi:hypothetical protein